MNMIINLDTKKIVSDINNKVTHTIDNINELYVEKTTPKSYRLIECTSIYGLTEEINKFLKETKKMDTQVLKLEDGNVIIQSRTEYGNVKQFIGLDKAVTVTINKSKNDTLDILIGESKWIDKGLTLAASFITVWPLAVSSGIGIYQQVTLNNELNNVINEYFDCKN